MRLVLLPGLGPDTELVAGGGHLIAMTHPEAVSRFLARSLG